MHYPKPVLTTESEGDGVRVTARYETPEAARMIESLRAIAAGAIGLALLVLGFGVHGKTFDDWLSGQAILSAALIVIISVFAAKIAAQRLYRHRFFLRGVMDAQLDVIVSRYTVKHATKSYDRTQVLRFTAAAHRQGRYEERSERVKERLLSTTYREAWQVWLQSGENFVLLAEVSDEQGAQTIVRRLQVEDENISRTAKSGENFGPRHSPV